MLRYCTLLLFSVPFTAFAQQPIQIVRDSMIPKMIVIDSTGIAAVSRTVSDTLLTEIETGTVLYSYPDGHESFWYKIKIEYDCQVTFEIFPSAADNIYNYFLYKHTGDISPAEIKEKKIAPFRANLCKNEMALSGTGISLASAVNFYDASSKTQVKDFYYTQYHAAVQVKKGEVLVLNVYHIKGTDCGYQLKLNAGNYTQKFRTCYASCCKDLVPPSRLKRTVRPAFTIKIPQLAKSGTAHASVSASVPYVAPKAIFIVRDSLKHIAVESAVLWTKHKNPNPAMKNIEKGKIEITLEKNTGYHLIFSSMGYKSSEVYFVTGESVQAFTNEVYLSPCKAGDNFVMDKIYFFPNTYKMKPGSTVELDQLAAYLLSNPGIQIEIQGHTNGNNRIKASYDTDFKGSSKKLSQYRADVIKQYLTSKGISADRLLPVGYGGSKMIFPDAKNQAQANKNIRVEVLILSQKEGVLSKAGE